MAEFGDVLRGLGSVLNPQVAAGLERENLLQQQQAQQMGMMALQQKLTQQSPQYQMQMEALQNERGFRQEMQGAGGDPIKVAQAAVKFGKPEIAMNIYNQAEARAERARMAKEALDQKMLELQMRLDDKATGREQQAQYQQMLLGMKQQQLALQAQIAQGNQTLQALGLDLKRAQIANQPDPSKNTPEFKEGLKAVTKDDQQAAQVAQLETALKRWQELNRDVTTGRISGLRPGIGQPQFQELQQLENYLAVNNFKPGQGQISNFERQLIKGAGPSTKNDPEVNDRIINIQLGAVQNLKDKAAFKEWYLEKNKKILGADKAWSDYIEANPRYTKGKAGEVVENASRKDWQEFFKAGAPKSGNVFDAADAIIGGAK